MIKTSQSSPQSHAAIAKSSTQPALFLDDVSSLSGCLQILSLDPAPGHSPALWGRCAGMWDGQRLTLTEATELDMSPDVAERWVEQRIREHDRGLTVVLVENSCTGPALFRRLGDDVEVHRLTPRKSKTGRVQAARLGGSVGLYTAACDWSDFRLICGLSVDEAVHRYSHVLDAVSQAVLWCRGVEL